MAELKNEQKKALAKDVYLLGSFTFEDAPGRPLPAGPGTADGTS